MNQLLVYILIALLIIAGIISIVVSFLNQTTGWHTWALVIGIIVVFVALAFLLLKYLYEKGYLKWLGLTDVKISQPIKENIDAMLQSRERGVRNQKFIDVYDKLSSDLKLKWINVNPANNQSIRNFLNSESLRESPVK